MRNENLKWEERWEDRGRAVRAVLGDTTPPDSVIPFSWKHYTLPGACALTFRLTGLENGFVTMSLGLSQPLTSVDNSYPWEFSIRTAEQEVWAPDLIYQLVTQWLFERGDMGFGYRLPFIFFEDQGGRTWTSIAGSVPNLTPVGAMRALYLWEDEKRIRFSSTSGNFGLLTAVLISDDEEEWANDATPAHLMLLLRRLGVSQICDPSRSSVRFHPRASGEWNHIKYMPEDNVLAELRL